MKRREFIKKSAAFGALSSVPAFGWGGLLPVTAKAQRTSKASDVVLNPLAPPPSGQIPVAFVISDGAVMIDFAGPWEVFQDVHVRSRGRTMDEQMPFRPYTVADKLASIRTSGGMKIQPEYTFANAPAPKVIVIPAQSGSGDVMLNWIKTASQHADVTISVCTGAFILAKTGLLSGKAATTHHSAYRQFGNAISGCPGKTWGAVRRSGQLRHRWWAFLGHRSGLARSRALFRAQSCGRHRLQHGIPGTGLDGP